MPVFLSVPVTTALAFVSFGRGLYAFRMVCPFSPRRPDLPDRGGLSRRRFWILAHVAFELALTAALVVARLLVALASHAIMRIWSTFDFIPTPSPSSGSQKTPRAPGRIDAAGGCHWIW